MIKQVWFCLRCHAVGYVLIEPSIDVYDALRAIRDAHQERSSTCRALFEAEVYRIDGKKLPLQETLREESSIPDWAKEPVALILGLVNKPIGEQQAAQVETTNTLSYELRSDYGPDEEMVCISVPSFEMLPVMITEHIRPGTTFCVRAICLGSSVGEGYYLRPPDQQSYGLLNETGKAQGLLRMINALTTRS